MRVQGFMANGVGDGVPVVRPHGAPSMRTTTWLGLADPFTVRCRSRSAVSPLKAPPSSLTNMSKSRVDTLGDRIARRQPQPNASPPAEADVSTPPATPETLNSAKAG